MILSKIRTTKALIRLRGCAGWSAPVLFANPEDRFSHVAAHCCADIFDNITGRPYNKILVISFECSKHIPFCINEHKYVDTKQIMAPLSDIPMFYTKYLTMCKVHIHAGTIRKLLYGCAYVWAIIHELLIHRLSSHTDVQ